MAQAEKTEAEATAELAPDFTLKGESGEVACLGFSPDGTLLAVGFDSSQDCLIINMAEESVVETLTEGHLLETTATTFSPDGEYLATASSDIDALIWRVRDWKLLHSEAGYTLKTSGRTPVAWGPNSDMLACSNARDRNVKLIVKRGEDSFQTYLGPHSFPNVIATMAFNPDGKTVAACDRDGNLNIYTVNLGLEAPLSHVRSLPVGQPSAPLFFTPDGSALWVVKAGVTICSLEGDVHTQTSNAFDGFADAAVAPAGHTLVVSRGERSLEMLDLNDLSATRTTLRITPPLWNTIALSPIGDVALSEGTSSVAVYRGAAIFSGLTKAAR